MRSTRLRCEPFRYPPDATERAVFWAGPEHLFVVRQAQGRETGEVWLVPLTEGAAPRRIMGGVALPKVGPYNGWRWNDVFAIQVLD